MTGWVIPLVIMAAVMCAAAAFLGAYLGAGGSTQPGGDVDDLDTPKGDPPT
jgi:hypothetical protein